MMLDTYPDSFATVEYHVGDVYSTDWAYDRADFYHVSGTPTTWFDGVVEFAGTWDDVQAQFDWYEEEYLLRQAVPTDVTIDVTGDPIGGQTYQVQANVCVELGGIGKTMRVYMAQVLDYWPTTVGYSRDGFKQAAETKDITVAPGTCRDVQRAFTFDAESWANQGDIKIVVWAQDPDVDAPAEVHQAAVMAWPFPALNLPACCLIDADCIAAAHNDCVALGGEPQGPSTYCSTSVCLQLKWAQPPTLNPESPYPECFWGWDEFSAYDCGIPGCRIVADDFECTDQRPITEIHWWGSYLGWGNPLPPPGADPDAPDSFHIGIWTDVPAGQDEVFSHPGTMIWEWVAPRSDLNERNVGCDFHPNFPAPDTCFRYDFTVPPEEWFFQDPSGDPTIYWISIAAHYATGEPGIPWGWKTREHFYNDDAIVILDPNDPTPDSVYVGGFPIENPEGVSWDMAFVLANACTEIDPPTKPAGEPGYRKIRYISMVPGNPGMQTALRVTLRTMPPPYAGFSGQKMWVGNPQTKCENAGIIDPPCPPVSGLPSDFQSANLQCTPNCMDWSTVGMLHVTDDEIIPGAVYDVQAVPCSCDLGNEDSYTTPLTINTSRWGDLVKNCTVIPCGPPDGIVNVTTDVTSVLDKYKNLPNAVMKSRADHDWNVPDWLINISDVTFCLDAFLGSTYPPAGWTGPGGCP